MILYQIIIKWIELPELFTEYVNINKHIKLTDKYLADIVVKEDTLDASVRFDFFVDDDLYELVVSPRDGIHVMSQVKIINPNIYNFLMDQVPKIRDRLTDTMFVPYIGGHCNAE